MEFIAVLSNLFASSNPSPSVFQAEVEPPRTSFKRCGVCHSRERMSEDESILEAASRGDIDTLKEYLNVGCDLGELQDGKGMGLLHVAVKNAACEALEALLSAPDLGLDIDRPTSSGDTLVHTACRRGDVRVLRLVLQKMGGSSGVAANALDAEGFSPLHTVTVKGSWGCSQVLLSYGADVNSRTKSGSSPLHWACSRGHLYHVKQLLGTYGADLEAESDSGSRPLHWAASKGQLEIVTTLVGTYCAEVDSRDARGCTPLLMAALNGHCNVVELLADRYGAQLKASMDKKGTSPLHAAAEAGHTEMVRLLLDKYKLPLERTDKFGCTALGRSARGARLDVLQTLLDPPFGANPHARTLRGSSLLHLAAEGGATDIITLLVGSLQFDVEDRNEEGETPLLCAAARGQEAAVALLARTLNAKVAGVVDIAGNTALHKAVAGGHGSTAALLAKISPDDVSARRADGKAAIHLAASSGYVELSRSLVSWGASVADVDNAGSAALHLASTAGHVEVARVLVTELGANPRDRDGTGKTPLETALTCGRQEMADFLLGLLSEQEKNPSLNGGLRRAGRWLGMGAGPTSQAGAARLSDLSLQNVLVIPVPVLLQQGHLPTYYDAYRKKLLVRGSDLPPGARVLLFTHAWEAPGAPDPTGCQFAALSEFLESTNASASTSPRYPDGEGVDRVNPEGAEGYGYVWFMYSCMNHNRIKPDFQLHLKNVVTAICRADHALIVPSMASRGPYRFSDMDSFCGRGWCLVELLSAIFLGVRVTMHFAYDDRPGSNLSTSGHSGARSASPAGGGSERSPGSPSPVPPKCLRQPFSVETAARAGVGCAITEAVRLAAKSLIAMGSSSTCNRSGDAPSSNRAVPRINSSGRGVLPGPTVEEELADEMWGGQEAGAHVDAIISAVVSSLEYLQVEATAGVPESSLELREKVLSLSLCKRDFDTLQEEDIETIDGEEVDANTQLTSASASLKCVYTFLGTFSGDIDRVDAVSTLLLVGAYCTRIAGPNRQADSGGGCASDNEPDNDVWSKYAPRQLQRSSSCGSNASGSSGTNSDIPSCVQS